MVKPNKFCFGGIKLQTHRRTVPILDITDACCNF